MTPWLSRSISIGALALLASCGSKNGVQVFNTPPSATISTPGSGSAFDQYETVTFTGKVNDDQDDNPQLEIHWSSSIDGVLEGALPADLDGNVRYSTANLSPGNHVITLLVVDSAAESVTSEITITINDQPESPQLDLIHPVSGEYGQEGETFEFVIRAVDSKDHPADLDIVFTSDVDGTFCTPTADGEGLARCDQELTPGDHFLTFRATDTDGEVGSVTAYFTQKSLSDIDNDGDGFSENQGDCDDTDEDIYPGATETADGVDEDCDGIIDNDTPAYDDDGDGFSENEGDCDDADATVYPGGTETYDGDDEDCDGLIDEGTTGYDDDGDGYTEIAGDCDDGYVLTYPGATELADGRDNDCDGIVDEGTDNYDDDGDGYSEAAGDCDDDDDEIHPGATETCDGVDNNCTGGVDESGASGCTTYYRDYDGDGYGTSTLSECLCSSSGYYTSRYSNDCYDYNSSAYPGASSWQTSHRGDGDYDWNCDSTSEKRYTTAGACTWDFACDLSVAGWTSGTPSCGSYGRFATTDDDCSWDWGSFSCKFSTSSSDDVDQACR
ncbi:MAG: putative metal-binding motif-containing protein [Alphaproteobacteria bacterium]|nr:putative metal-binding motif-containing protein [Alphaproteobacteria bacterium]